MTAIGFLLFVLSLVILHYDTPLTKRERIVDALMYLGTAIGTAGVFVWLWRSMP